MSCHVETPATGPFAGGTVFYCWHDENKPCAFCSNAGEYLCDWPTDRFVEATAHDLRHGDVARFVWPPDEGFTPTAWIVYNIQAKSSFLRFDVKLADRGSVRNKLPFRSSYSRYPTAAVYVRRPRTCDQPACGLHVRELADEMHYCAGCWEKQDTLIEGQQTARQQDVRLFLRRQEKAARALETAQ